MVLRDVLYLAWIVACVVLIKVANRTPALALPQAQTGRCLLGLIVISLAIGGSGVGAFVPHLVAVSLPHRNAFGYVMDTNIDALGRLSQIIGAACGVYIALRAIWLWCVLGVLGVAIYLVVAAANYVLGGPSG